MQLTYRGVSYEFNPPKVEMINSHISAKFLGVAYSVHRPRHPLGAGSSTGLSYRGFKGRAEK